MKETKAKKEWLKPELKFIEVKMETENDSSHGGGGDASGYAS
jgi:hypothetical protein